MSQQGVLHCFGSCAANGDSVQKELYKEQYRTRYIIKKLSLWNNILIHDWEKKNPEGKGTSSHCHFYLDLNAEINTLQSKTGSTE